ncbi:MAG: transglycosylase domain-containing protein [Lachnospiraceae bacterium]|nr:transglycosylase domain-containing protein [Lachnospiraceae bacterium]
MGDVFRIIIATLMSYLGIVSNIVGTIIGIFASVLIVGCIVGICLYIKVLPVFTEARETVFDKLVSMSEDDFVMKEDTVVFDKNGEQVGKVNAGRFKYMEIKEVSPYLYNGYIAVEDKRFKTHTGVDVLATMRAGVALAKNKGDIKQGGSTITQQVIKNNLLTQEKSYTRKIAEIMLAPSVEEKFSKDKIMEFYCNSNYYGNRCYGVGAASEYYFNKKAADLEPHEAALLIALSNNPSAYDPVNKPDAALVKRNEILDKMYNEGVITQKEYNSAKKKKVKALQIAHDGANESYVVSYAVHCAALSLMEKEEFKFQYTFKNKEDYEDYKEKYSNAYSKKSNDIRDGGYKLYTSIDMSKQKKLQKAVDNGLAFSKEKNSDKTKYALQGAAVCVDNHTNYVVAIVGGRGTKDSYNRAYLSARQSGSSIKPLIDYTPGFETGAFSPSTVVKDQKIENGPKNSGGGYRGNVHIREAVARSINTVAWQVLDTITPEYGLSFLDKLHFHNLSYVDNDNLSLSLGGFTEGVRVVDMAKGYSALANNGSYSERTCIQKIEHVSEGTVYNSNDDTTQVFTEDAAWMMTDVLKGVMNESYGTGHSLKLDNKQIAAGKTGTANSSKDVWFCGYTKYYTTVVWAGYDTPRAMPGVTGASLPGVIWKNFMNQIHKNKEPEDFEPPSGIILAKYDSKGNLIKGTESDSDLKRTFGKDFFSKNILKSKTKYESNLIDDNYEKKVLRKLEAFEKLSITSIADYYTLKSSYQELRDLISAIEDDEVRKTYATRAKDKYDSLYDDTVEWEKVVEEYEQQRREANEELAREKKAASREARKQQQKKTRIARANTRLKALRGYDYQPENMSTLLKKAKEAVDACKEYSEYASLNSKYESYSAALYKLPTKAEYDARKNGSSAVVPAQTKNPMVTYAPNN